MAKAGCKRRDCELDHDTRGLHTDDPEFDAPMCEACGDRVAPAGRLTCGRERCYLRYVLAHVPCGRCDKPSILCMCPCVECGAVWSPCPCVFDGCMTENETRLSFLDDMEGFDMPAKDFYP